MTVRWSTGRRPAFRLALRVAPGMRVGLYGGSFDPAHEGHAHVARTAARRLGLDRVIWLVAPRNPLKTSGAALDLAARQTGVARLARGPLMVVSDAERRLATRYTIDTVRALKVRFPGVHFVWIMGADGLGELHRWREWTALMREIPVAVVARPGASLRSRLSPAARRFAAARLPSTAARRLVATRPPAWVYIAAPWNFASSTALRQRAGAEPPGMC
ncbi:MAG: nicotinate-nucleotide adenylyltransferase [Caulobacteraceae bacterium]